MITIFTRFRGTLGGIGPGLALLFIPLVASAADHWETRAQGVSRRTGNSAVWTGREMIVWGGGSQSVWLGDGGRYDLQGDSWRPTSNSGAPSPRWFHGAVWTGREMLVWGGRANFFQSNAYNDGGRYDPTNDTWTAMSTAAAPAARSQFGTVWTGTEMLVWGGWALDENTTRGDGAAYNPSTDSWRTMSNVNAPSSRVEPTAVWTGSEMIIFGGMDATGGGASGWVTRNTGARYNPQTDAWTPLPTDGAPSITAHTAVWTGTDMIVWGGRYLPANTPLNTGARYNLAENKWYPIATPNLGVRIYHSAVWSGSEMLVWGGGGPNNLFNDGARYNPTSDAWSSITQENAPQARHFWRPDLGIWTGRGLLFYGGSYYPQEVDSTAYYIPGRTDGPPEIWAQPRSLTTVEGENVSFSVSADGAQPLSYQWSHNGLAIADATTSILRINGVQRSDAGIYSVTVSNSSGIATSSDAELRIVDVPIISNISPRIGPTGTVVTITGRNFGATPSENTVRLGAVQAAVSAASATSLAVTVPDGTTFMPLVVTVHGLSAYAPTPFSATFPTRNLDASAFSEPESLTPGDGPIATAIGDLDGDGLPDLVVANHYGGSQSNRSEGTIALYRNAGGSPQTFAEPVLLSTGVTPWDMVLADIDGDGKLDIATINLSANTVSVRLNSSTVGQLTFGARRDFAVGANPHQGAIGDIDRDGRPDIVTANYQGGTVSVLRNVTQPGGPADFEGKVDFQTAFGTHGVGLADLDGDGKLDVVAAHHNPDNGATVVLRNTSQVGVIDATSLTVTARLPGNGAYVAFGDLDGDGRLEIVIPSWYSKDISIFRNLSSSGNLDQNAFGARVVLPSPGSTKRVAIADLDGDGRLDLVFPTELESALSFYRNAGGSNDLDASWFAPRVDLPAGWNGDGISVGDLDRDGMPDIVFCNFYDDAVWIYRGVRVTAPAITQEPASQTVPLGASAAIAVQAAGGRLQYHWYHNGVLLEDAVGAAINFENARSSDAGDYQVVVQNSGGSVTSQVATLTVVVDRVLFLGTSPDVNEGDLVAVPLQLSSHGDVGGIDFLIEFDPDKLAAPDVVWESLLDGALKQLSVPAAGQLQGVIALPATSIPSGTQTLATIQFRARTVLSNTRGDLTPTILDVSNEEGDPIRYGSDTAGTSVGIGDTGSLAGDNNGNQRLDVGDASLVMRLIAQLDSVRPWDLTGNDLNKNQRLDSGDVIKILRIVAGIDPPPSPPAASGLLASAALPATSELAALSPARFQGTAGQLVTVQLRLSGLETPISGASLTLNYPSEALRLQSSQSHRLGSSVPGSAAAIWNVGPAQNNYATQNGHITLAVSSSTAWSADNNVLAEFTFEVQPAATNRYQWPISLSSVEVTGNGYNNRSLTTSGSAFIGRNAVSGSLLNLTLLPSGAVSFNLSADAGADYRIDFSDDLVHWSLLKEVLNHSGSTQISDPGAAGHARRFYRSVPLR